MAATPAKTPTRTFDPGNLHTPRSPFSPKTDKPLLNLLKSAKKTKSIDAIRAKAASMDVVADDWRQAASGAGDDTAGAGSRGKERRKIAQTDRFIPNRHAMDMEAATYLIDQPQRSSQPTSSSKDSSDCEYEKELARACGLSSSCGDPSQATPRVLAFHTAPPTSAKEDLRRLYTVRTPRAVSAQQRRAISTTAERVLDAPGLVDDYYLSLLDWSMTNCVAIGLEACVYLWQADSGNVSVLSSAVVGEDTVEERVSAVKFSRDGAYTAVARSGGSVEIWDTQTGQRIRSMLGRSTRAGVLSWERHIISSGGRDGAIWHHDVRVAQHKLCDFTAHASEVCGLAWRVDGVQLASGGNDNVVCVWDGRNPTARFSKSTHTAAVKAIAWCPWQLNLLASGGGSHDRHIHFWNSNTGTILNSINTGSQVTSIQWSPHEHEFVSCHGFPDHQISVWTYPGLKKLIDIPAHDSRVLHSALSPDGLTLATAASDENLKFWKIWDYRHKAKDESAERSESGRVSGNSNGSSSRSRMIPSRQIR